MMKHSPSFLTYYLKICGIHYKIRLLFSLEFYRQADFTDLNANLRIFTFVSQEGYWSYFIQ